MKTKKYVDFDNEVQEEIKQCLMEDRLATTKTSSLEQAKEFVALPILSVDERHGY
jgi:hypothetical protein